MQPKSNYIDLLASIDMCAKIVFLIMTKHSNGFLMTRHTQPSLNNAQLSACRDEPKHTIQNVESKIAESFGDLSAHKPVFLKESPIATIIFGAIIKEKDELCIYQNSKFINKTEISSSLYAKESKKFSSRLENHASIFFTTFNPAFPYYDSEEIRWENVN